MSDVLTDAIRYWEPRRIAYNLVLGLAFAGCVIATWPQFAGAMRLDVIVPLAILAVLANLCYTAAYVADVPMQLSGFRAAWRQYRMWLWIGGTGFAVLLTLYWTLDEILPGLPH